MSPKPLFTFDDEIEGGSAPAIPSVTNPFPQDYTFDEQGARFLDDGKVRPETTLSKVARNLTPWAIANNVVVEPIVTTGNTLGGLPDAYSKLRAGKNAPNKIFSVIGSPVQSLLDSATRNEPPETKEAAQARLISSAGVGAAGTAVGAGVGAIPIFSVPTMGASVPIGAFLGGAAGTTLGDMYAREKLQSKLNPATGKPFLAQQDPEQESSDDWSNFITSLIYGKGAQTTKAKIAKGAGSRVVSSNKTIEAIDRGTDPASLQAQALGATGKDYVIRAPRTEAPGILNVTPRNSIEVVPESGVSNLSDNIKRLTSEYEQLLTFDEPNQTLLDGTTAPAVMNQLDNLFEDPNTNLPTTGNQPNVAGNTTSINIEPNEPLPGVNRRNPNQYYLDQALNEPGMQQEMAYTRTGEKSEFDTLTPHAVNRQIAAKNENLEILRSIPEDQYPTIGDVLFRDFDQNLNAANIPQFRKRPYYDVLYDELSLAPRILGWTDADPRAKDFKALAARQRLSERGGARTVNDGQPAYGLTPEEQTRFNGYLQEIEGTRISPELMDELKTQFASGAKYEKKHGTNIDPKTNRSDAYQFLSDNLRNATESIVNQTRPEDFSRFRQNNRKMQILNQVEDLSKKRAAEENLIGRDKLLEENKRAPNGVIGLVGDAARSLKRVFIPEPQSREAKLRAADQSNFNRGTGADLVGIPQITKGLAKLDRALNSGIEGYQKATTSQFTNSDPRRPPQVGIEGVQGGLLAQDSGEAEKANTVGQSWLEQLGSAVSKINPFVTKEAGAQELTMADKLPRRTELMNSESIAKFLQNTVTTPEKAPIAQGLVKKMVEASNVGDMDKVEKIHADMVKLFPEQFESGFGVNGKVFHPDDQAKIMDNLKKLHREGVVDNIFLAKQRNAFADPMDARILPTPQPFVGAKQPPSQYDKTINTFINEDNNKFSPEDTMRILHWLTLGHQSPDAQPPPVPTKNPANRNRLIDGTRRYSY